MNVESQEKQIEELMPRVSLAAIVSMTALALVLAIVIDSGLPSFNKTLITGAMLVVSISDVLVVRMVVLPALSRNPNSSRAHVFTVGYAQTMSLGVFAVVLAIAVNEWWVSLTFGVLGMVFWLVVRDFIDGLPLSRSDAQA